MPTVLHIDRHSTEPVDYFEIKAGETLKEVLDRMDCTWRTEDVPPAPRPPRKLDPRAESFLAGYKREDPSAVLAVFWRYHSLEAEEFDTAEEAKRFIDSGEDYGSLAGEAIVDGDEIEVWD